MADAAYNVVSAMEQCIVALHTPGEPLADAEEYLESALNDMIDARVGLAGVLDGRCQPGMFGPLVDPGPVNPPSGESIPATVVLTRIENARAAMKADVIRQVVAIIDDQMHRELPSDSRHPDRQAQRIRDRVASL